MTTATPDADETAQALALKCSSCKAGLTAGAFLTGCSDFWWEMDVVQFTCPLCHRETDARVEHSLISLGYIYGAGSPHFCGMTDVPIDGLRVWREGGNLFAEFGDKTWTIHSRR